MSIEASNLVVRQFLYNTSLENFKFNGIIRNLTDRYGGNLHENTVVEITCSSTSNHGKPWFALNLQSEDDWWSGNAAYDWWKCDFKARKVQLTGYTLRTNSAGLNGSHLKNWILDGSNDNIKWVVMDERVNNSDLNGSNLSKYFAIEGNFQPFRYIRIRLSGLTHLKDNLLCLSGCEFFGNLIEPSE